MTKTLHIIGSGLAGSEAAWQAAERGVSVVIHEMRPVRPTEAHHTGFSAELVCSNSFRSDDHTRNAVGLIHEEMRRCGSLIMRCADAHRVPAGGALAVDRDGYAQAVTEALENHPNIRFEREEITALPTEGMTIVATGPLTSKALSASILQHTGEEYLAFFDAIAPIVHRDSIDMGKAWFQSRYDKGDGKDYINCPMDKEQYLAFIEALNAGEKTEFKEWETNTPYFEGCLPIEVMAARGPETLRYGPMKPVGLTNPHALPLPPLAGGRADEARDRGVEAGLLEPEAFSQPPATPSHSPESERVPRQWGKEDRPGKCYAIVQLRQDNKLGTLWNMVGFQTKLKYGEQQRIFRAIPGLENAEFARLGGIHRNTFINSPKLLDSSLRLKTAPHIRFAGQVTGVEGYVESAACGLMAGRFAAEEILYRHSRESGNLRSVAGQALEIPAFAGMTEPWFNPPPRTTALGSLLAHITGEANAETFQPMNVNFGLFLPLEEKVKKDNRPEAYTSRALRDLAGWLGALKAAA